MAKDKDRTLNPAAAQRKAEKQKALKKGKAAVAAQRTERYATRNPARLERTIEALKAEKEVKGGKLGSRDQKLLEDAERDLARVKKAREALGDKAPAFGGRDGRGGGGGDERGGRGGGRGRGDGDGGRGGHYMGLGKRGREDEEGSSGSETDESVRKIPWPRDTPPPIPHQHRQRNTTSRPTNANEEPLGASRMPARDGEGEVVPNTSLPPKPVMKAKTTYESAPVVRDLQREATSRFVPSAVRRKIEAKAGKGGRLLEEEEVQGLEREGYGGAGGGGMVEVGDGEGRMGGSERGGVVIDAAPAAKDGEGGDKERKRERRRLEEEEERFRREMEMEIGGGSADEGGAGREEEARGVGVGVEMEEVSDEDL
ncbi:hypothetical protein JMJ35_010402 [Cladonia borealis]|uniref:Wbp11/ELF5/Saf1 N-terminal domain-containing protein n=1 Tax=Cladonia borealis TaxID=184061 RepID=A0AA39QT07_9LECA|nr:hypothetical protein JMJ35_010402 [Cladonia borealis]